MKNHVFSRHLLDPIFLDLIRSCAKKVRFWDPFKIQWGAKLQPKSLKVRQNADHFLVMRTPLCSHGTDLRFRGRPMRPRPRFERFLMDFGTLKAS